MKLGKTSGELRMRRDDLETVIRKGREQFPMETCGLMVGRREGKACVCDHIVPTENAERSSVSFTISPEELLSGYLHADELDMELVGIYHSHPAPAAPSRTDLGFMKWSAPVWLIVSSLDWRYAAFRSEEGKAVELRLKLV